MKRLALILLTITSLHAAAQQWGVALTGGYTLPNDPASAYVAGALWGVDGSLRWRTSGREQWQRLWHLPSFGLRANYAHLLHGVAGDRIGVAGFVSSPFGGEASHWAWELDLGLSAYTNPYSRTPDPANRFIGSYLNCLIQAGLEYRHPLASGHTLTLAGKFVHSSNGYLRKPNLGLNFLQGEVGLLWPQQRVRHIETTQPQRFPVADYLSLSYAPGLARPRWSGGRQPLYYCHTAEAAVMWRPGERLAWGFGADLSHNYSQGPLTRHHRDLYTLPFTLGGFASVEPYWGPLSVRLSLGGYLLRSRKTAVMSLPFYERVGAFYHLPCGLFAGVSMRAYAAHIDFIEWNLGYKIPLNNP